MLRKTVQAISFLLFTSVVFAQEEKDAWAGTISLGYLSTSGDTDTTSYSTKFEFGYTKNDWEHSIDGGTAGAEDRGATTAENYKLGWHSARNFTEHDFLFGTVDWRKDRFGGVTEQVSYAFNYGRRFIDTPEHQLDLGIGAGYRDWDRSDGKSNAGAIGRGSIAYNWYWSEFSDFMQELTIESGSGNTYIESVSALRSQLIGGFNLVLSYTIQQNSSVPAGADKTDIATAVSIEYGF